MIYGYGGDFNRFDASDINFCNNGLISPDRVPNPHMYEVGYFYQNIWTTLGAVPLVPTSNGSSTTKSLPTELELRVFNEHFSVTSPPNTWNGRY